jgi:hypothetical protein
MRPPFYRVIGRMEMSSIFYYESISPIHVQCRIACKVDFLKEKDPRHPAFALHQLEKFYSHDRYTRRG